MISIGSLVIMGAQCDGLVVLESVRRMAQVDPTVRPVGFLDDGLPRGSEFAGLPVLGRLDEWAALPEEYRFIPVLHKFRQMPQRVARILGLGVPEQRWATVIDPKAVLAGDAAVGHGSYIGPNVVVQPESRLGNFLSIRAGASLGHEVVLKDFAYVGPNCVLCGRASIGRASHIAAGAVVADDIRVGEFSAVGIVSAVNREIPPYSLAMGNPARVVARLDGTGQ